ncbi:ATP-dependent DNA helicase [Bacillus songklensis]|uniref:ATP-dependent DNA helicase n=1 Tax=Bacillus songklensis TaxID=1069116 RepID=A0ABV8AZW7_9BACI
MSNEVKISVRPLVEYVYRSGSIESGFRTSTTLTEGTRAHQKVQKMYKEADQKEVYMKTEIPFEDLTFQIEGRCDGLLFSGEEVTIDEIKSTAKDLHSISKESYPVHWAQAKCYAYMYAKEHGIQSINVQLTYIHVETEEKKQFKEMVSFQELAEFILDVVKHYAPYASLKQNHREKRDSSIKKLDFPFETYREGQRKFAGAVYKTIAEGKSLFAMAPTGIGKTISTIFPSVKAIGEGLLQRLFYLTAKTTTRATAEETFSFMQDKGLCMNVVTITAKEKVCFQEEAVCQKKSCEYADGYYDRINGAVLDILSNETIMNRSVIEKYARKHKVCPFEFSLDIAYAADAIICDYNYVFDPRVSLKRLVEEQKKQTALLVDEAHNLVDRARDMFSSELSKSAFLHVKREYKGKSEAIAKAASDVNNYLLGLRKRCGEQKNLLLKERQDEFVELLEVFILQAEKELVNEYEGQSHTELLDLYFSVHNFIRISKLYDERYVTYIEYERSEVVIKMFCLDPSNLLRQMGKGYWSKVYFSATLAPLRYYKEILGGQEEDLAVSIPSPFRKEQLEVFIQPLSTRYHDRERSKDPIVKMLSSIVEKNKGNYLIFFPSYQYLSDIYEQFTEQYGEENTIRQNAKMTEEEREQFLAAFQVDQEETLIGFAVLGGIFSEGIDLKGNRLTGVVIVGVGLPQLSLERNIIKNYFNENGKNGYDYAYVFPGMNKVLQAGGRLIRSEQDEGTIVLVDDRFLQSKYQSFLPDIWKHYTLWQE